MNLEITLPQRIFSIEELRPIISKIQRVRFHWDFMEFYRGQALDTYKLKSTIARHEYSLIELQNKERELFSEFQQLVTNGEINCVQRSSINNDFKHSEDWHSYFQARHLGVDTRLMDWTIVWKVALLFAVDNEKYYGQDGQFWIFFCPERYHINYSNAHLIMDIFPFDIEESVLINHSFFDDSYNKYIPERRRARQQGKFLMQPLSLAATPLEEQDEFRQFLCKIIIDGGSKKRIKEELSKEIRTADWFYDRDEELENKINLLNKRVMGKL